MRTLWRLRLKWIWFTTYMRYIYGKIKDGKYICADCGDIIDKKTVIEHIYADLTREEMACKPCIIWDNYIPEEEPEYDPEYSEEEPYIDYEEMWMR